VTVSAGLYVHLPWCTRKCPYCDFNSYQADVAPDEGGYVAALLADLELALAQAGAPTVASIFIGGGTPSLFSAAAIARLLDGIAARCRLAGDLEVTLEANPGSAEAGRFAGYAAAGVNRLSLGIQSFADTRLAALGRVHDGDAARRAIALARRAGFASLNLDLMFGLPHEQPGDSLRDLDEALRFAPEHLSWYQLTLEAGTAFARRPPPLPGHDQICDDYEAGLARLADAGYAHYEISAHARAAHACRHNLNYWQFGDYLGIGAGAHGKRAVPGGIVRSERIRHPARYLAAARAGNALAGESFVGGAVLASEFMLNALRLRAGFALAQFERATGLAARTIAAPLATALARGWLSETGERYAPTALGFRFLNDLQLLFVTAPAGHG
jgi:putative oxygen-independent coproporphyrinogen III oxidase